MSVNNANFPDEVWDGLAPNRDSRDIDAGPDYEDWDQVTAEVVAIQDYLLEPQASGGTDGTSVVSSSVHGVVNVTTLTITDLAVATVDATTAGAHGSAPLFTFPVGNILILGAVGTIGLVAGAGGIADTAAVVAAIGTVATSNADATLTSTEADIVPSTSATLSGGANAAVDLQNTATLVKDGTSSAGVARLNLAMPDAGSTANDTLTVNGTVTITWINLGDN